MKSLGEDIFSVKTGGNKRGMLVWIDEAEASYYEAITFNFDDDVSDYYRYSRLYDVFADCLHNKCEDHMLLSVYIIRQPSYR